MVRISNERSETEGAARLRRRTETRRLEILHAAARVFRGQGFAAAGMREIAAEADLSPANLYHYFSGKHEILFFCQDRSLDQMLAALDEARSTDGPVAAQLRAVLQAHVRCMLGELEGSTAHLEVEALPPELRDRVIAKRDRYERGIRALVRNGVRAGEFADCDVKLVTQAMLGALNWTARWFRPEGARSASAVADSISQFLMRGLQPAFAAAADGDSA